MTGLTKQLDWRKSSRCGNTTCVEVAKGNDGVFVRDSKNPDVVLFFTFQEWAAFIAAAADGEFRY